MFQSFDTLADPTLGAARLSRLRDELAREGLDGFLVPRADEFQGEYVPPSAERLQWLQNAIASMAKAPTPQALKVMHTKYVRDADRRGEKNFITRLAKANDERMAELSNKEQAA